MRTIAMINVSIGHQAPSEQQIAVENAADIHRGSNDFLLLLLQDPQVTSNMDEIHSKYILDLIIVTSVESQSLHVTFENI